MDAMELNNLDLKEFMDALDTCKGDVFMVTPEGDRLNLKSKLTQLIGFTALIQGGTVTHAKIECENPEDESRLFRLNLFGKDGQLAK